MLNPAAGLSKDGAGASDWALSPASPPPAKHRPLLLGGVALATVACAAGVALGVLRPWQSPAGAPAAAYVPSADTLAVRAHVAAQISNCTREPAGNLTFPYLIPAGGYDQLWDWDSVFLGVATKSYDTAAFFAGSMMNFLTNVSLPDGEVRGCLTPDGSSPFLRHAKPILVWGAYLAAKATGNFTSFRRFEPQLSALLDFWAAPPRYDNASGCSLWYEMTESGADNLAYEPCAAGSMPCWSPSRAYSLATPDLPVFRERQATAYALFTKRWAAEDAEAAAVARASAASSRDAAGADAGRLAAAAATAAAAAEASASRARAAAARAASTRAEAARCLESLWLDTGSGGGYWTARNVSSGALLPVRTYQLAWPLWGTAARGDAPSRAAAAADSIAQPDMVAADSRLVRSLSSASALYTNEIAIPGVVGSNWRGPAWIPTNALLAYALAGMGRRDAAAALAAAITRTLAGDLARTGTWHENYNTDNVTRVMGAPGFLSFNTLAADIEQHLFEGTDPFALE